MSESIYTHYTYLLVDENHKKYGGVRSCKVTPKKDPYMGSSQPVDNAIDNGLIFTKHIIKTFDTREEANEYESDWLVRVEAAQSDDWYNQYNTYPKFHTQGKKNTKETISKRVESYKETMAKKTPEELMEISRNISKSKIGVPIRSSTGKTWRQKGIYKQPKEQKRKRVESYKRTMAKKTPEELAEIIRKRVETRKRNQAKKKGTVV